MFRWFHQRVAVFLTRAVEREILMEINVKDYANAIKLTSKYCENREHNHRAHWLHVHTLMGLHRYEDALAIVSRFEAWNDDGSVLLSSDWQAAFGETKCRAIEGLKRYSELAKFAKKQHNLHPNKAVFAAYMVLAAMYNGDSTEVRACADVLVSMDSYINQSWCYETLYSAYNLLGDKANAAKVALSAKVKYPYDHELEQVVSGDNSSVEVDRRTCIHPPGAPRCRQ